VFSSVAGFVRNHLLTVKYLDAIFETGHFRNGSMTDYCRSSINRSSRSTYKYALLLLVLRQTIPDWFAMLNMLNVVIMVSFDVRLYLEPSSHSCKPLRRCLLGVLE
jgi:hypothetical protein